MRERRTQPNGFTLIELMLVAAIISLLAAIAIPRFGEMIRKSKEAATLGHLGALRSAVTIYYSDNEGLHPGSLSDLTVGGKYISKITPPWTFQHGYNESPDTWVIP